MSSASHAPVAAFFDVDNTLVRGATLYHFARGMAQHNFFTRTQLLRGTWKQLKFSTIGREFQADLRQVTEFALSFIEGREEREIVELSRDVVDNVLLHRLWAGTVKIARQHLDAGHQVWLATASPHPVAAELAARLGLSGALGTQAETDPDGRYTGRLLGLPLHGDAKGRAVTEFAAERGIDLAASSAYSDSLNDLSLLRAVGHPAVVNPERRLRNLARAEGWPIIDYRRSRFLRASSGPFTLPEG